MKSTAHTSWGRTELSLKVGDGGNSGRRHIVGVLDASTSPPKERYAVSKDNIIKLI